MQERTRIRNQARGTNSGEQGGAGNTKGPRVRRILIVDDHPIFRHGIEKVINNEPGLTVCGQADCAAMALEAVRTLKPDLVTVDISLKGSNGLELIKSIQAVHPDLPILVISMHDEALYAIRALRAGARGYMMKQEPLDRMIDALRSVLEGKMHVSPELNNRIVTEFIQGIPENGASITSKLTDREVEVFEHIGRGKSMKEIAKELHLSIKTVETHRAHIKEKLILASAREVAQLARDWVENEFK